MTCPRGHEMILGTDTTRGGNAWFCSTCWESYPATEGGMPSDKSDISIDARGGSEGARRSELEELFLAQWTGPAPVEEHRFFPSRKWKFDFSWPDAMVAVEIEGTIHRISSRFHSDVEKYNQANVLGWLVMRCTGRMLRSEQCDFMETVLRLIEERKGK